MKWYTDQGILRISIPVFTCLKPCTQNNYKEQEAVLTVLPPTQIPPKPVVTELHLYLVLHSIKCYVFSGETNYSSRKKSRGHSRDPVYLGNQFPWRACRWQRPPPRYIVHTELRKYVRQTLNGLKIILFYLEHSLTKSHVLNKHYLLFSSYVR